MFRPPSDPYGPRDRYALTPPTLRSVLASFALVAAVPLALWAVSHPLAGVVVLVAVVGLRHVAGRALDVVRCFHDCRGFRIDVADAVRITVTSVRTDESS